LIIEQLFTLLINKEIKDFVEVLSEQVKNLAARLGKTGTLDKKVEKQIKSDLLAQFKTLA
jgi:F0F1-type ATP synthase membrane subunit b/b'